MLRASLLALRALAREWKSGELGVLLLALAIAVAALTGVGFLVNRIGIVVERQASQVLAADLRVQGTQPLPESYFREAVRRGIAATRTSELLSVVFHGEATQLAGLTAAAAGYPLRGEVTVADAPFGRGVPIHSLPARGEVWLDSKLMAALGAGVGSQVSIGSAVFRVGRVLMTLPDRGSTFADLAPVLLMNRADLDATQLLQPGSRVRHAALFAADRGRIESFKRWLTVHKRAGDRLLDVQDASPQIRSATDRAGRFLSLASLVSVLLCSIAVAMSARRYVQRHLDVVALMKTLGATRAFILSVSLQQLVMVALVAAFIGCAVGYATQDWLAHTLRGLLRTELPPARWQPIALGFGAAIAVLTGFALPPLLQLARVPALRVLRRDIGPPPPLVLLAFGPAVAALGILAWWVVRDRALLMAFIGLFAGFLLLLVLAGLALVHLAARLRGTVGVAWRYGLANLSRRRAESVTQIVAFGLALMALLLLAVVRRDLLQDWRASLPADVPNYFFVNIPPAEREAFERQLAISGGKRSRMLPMLRARLTSVNGRPAEELHFAGRDGGLATREQNITLQRDLGTDNRVVAGHWWTASDYGRPFVSVATEFQEALGLHLGDRLGFDVAGEPLEAHVMSIRKIKWDSFQPNFFIAFPPGLLEDAAGTYMTSARIEGDPARTIAALVRHFPSVSVFDVEDLLTQVRSVIDRAALAVQSVFVFTLFAGLTVLLAAVQANRHERRYESAMLRALGASRAVVRQGVLAEFATIGLAAGVLAAFGATIAGYLVATRLLELPYRPDAWVWVIGLAAGVLFVAASGWLATRSAVREPPLAVLQGD
ncbi:MAG: FtsX-like permease family protein [Gammaproteobacteria bacterium]|nr:FtsX-like permease family protein [Gammaproteobacteria bacterium]